MKIIEIFTKEEMLKHFEALLPMYPNLDFDEYSKNLDMMIKNGYQQIIVLENEKVIGITGLWKNTKIWSGKYLEIDNFVINPEYRNAGIGKKLTEYIDKMALEFGAKMIVLDAFVENFKAHKFYINCGYIQRGYHFIKKFE